MRRPLEERLTGGLDVCVGCCAETAKGKGFEFAGWRDVPTQPDVLGELARANMPTIKQFFLRAPSVKGDALERSLYLFRRSVRPVRG
jgi:glutamate synthase domain-containing protein 1